MEVVTAGAPTERRVNELPDLATRVQVAEYTQTSVPTLARWASEGRGPRFVRLGRGAVRYRRDDVLAWIAGLATGT